MPSTRVGEGGGCCFVRYYSSKTTETVATFLRA